MIKFSEFKKAVCNFYRQNKEFTYFIGINPDWQKTSIEVEFVLENVNILYAYTLSDKYTNKDQREKKAEKLIKEISKDLKGIENERVC